MSLDIYIILISIDRIYLKINFLIFMSYFYSIIIKFETTKEIVEHSIYVKNSFNDSTLV